MTSYAGTPEAPEALSDRSEELSPVQPPPTDFLGANETLDDDSHTHLVAAAALRSRGLSVIPVHCHLVDNDLGHGAGKRPLIAWKEFQDRLPEPDELRKWWTTWPMANIGVVTGCVSKLVVLDVDGDVGLESLLRMGNAPSTWRSSTGRGIHLFFRHPGYPVANAVKIAPGLDIRGDGGYVVVPPSLHVSGKLYKWQVELGAELADPPTWLIELMAKAEPQVVSDGGKNDWLQLLQGAPLGERHSVAARLTGRYLAMGRPAEEVETLLIGYASRCTPAFDVDEVIRIVADLAAKDAAKPSREVLFSPAEPPRPHVIRLGEVKPEPVKWLWPGRVAAGKLTLLIGDPGVGKSFLTLDMAARVTTARSWPDGGEPTYGAVVLVSAEDGPADTVLPRATALGADVNRIVLLRGIYENGTERGFRLAEDLSYLEDVIRESGAVLVVVDPLSTYLPKTNTYKESEVRPILAALAALAERTQVAIVAVLHLTKDDQRGMLYRAQGSVAFVAVARVGLVLAGDPADSARRLLAVFKTNLGLRPPALCFEFADSGIRWSAEPVDEADVARVLGGVNVLTTVPALAGAQEFLVAELQAGARLAREVFVRGRESGLSPRSLERAKKILGIRSYRRGGLGATGEWVWSLPRPMAAKAATAVDEDGDGLTTVLTAGGGNGD